MTISPKVDRCIKIYRVMMSNLPAFTEEGPATEVARCLLARNLSAGMTRLATVAAAGSPEAGLLWIRSWMAIKHCPALSAAKVFNRIFQREWTLGQVIAENSLFVVKHNRVTGFRNVWAALLSWDRQKMREFYCFLGPDPFNVLGTSAEASFTDLLKANLYFSDLLNIIKDHAEYYGIPLAEVNRPLKLFRQHNPARWIGIRGRGNYREIQKLTWEDLMQGYNAARGSLAHLWQELHVVGTGRSHPLAREVRRMLLSVLR